MKPALTLLLLGPWVAEYLLGSHTVVDLPLVVFLVPMYGGGALLIREVARRTGRGWPTMLLLGLAYGLIEAGLLDQSLFDPGYMEEDFNSITHIPWLGASATYTVAFVVGHTVWSIGTPIALVEAWWPSRADRPWLGRLGLGVAAALHLSGSALIRLDHRDTEQFTAATHQQLVAGLGAVALVAAAFLVGRRRPATSGGTPEGRAFESARPTDRRATEPTGRGVAARVAQLPHDHAGNRPIAPPPRRRTNSTSIHATEPTDPPAPAAPRPRRVAPAAFVVTAAFICVPGNWVGVGLALVLVGSAAAVLRRWSGRVGWGPAHRAALAAGALMTQAGVGFILHPWHEVDPALELTSDVLFTAVAAAMGAYAVRHARTKGGRGRVTAWSIRVATPPGTTEGWRRAQVQPPSRVSASSSGPSATVP